MGIPPFGAQIILNGHEYVACQARKQGIVFRKQGNCFVQATSATALGAVADTLGTESAIGLLRQVCERWIYTACLCFALDLDEQQRSGFRYPHFSSQGEYSRNYHFRSGRHREQVVQGLIERTRGPLRLDQVKTVFGSKHRPSRRKLDQERYESVVETPEYDVTVFKVHYGNLTLKIYTQGERTLRIEVVVHNTKQLGSVKRLERWPRIIAKLRDILMRFTEVVRCMDASFVADDLLERLPEPAQADATKVGGIDINKLRMRRLMGAVLALSSLPQGFTVCEVVAKVGQAAGPSACAYGPRQAAYDLRKLRSKGLMERIGNSRRYAVTWAGLRTLTALFVLRDKVIQPLLANAGQRRPGARPAHTTALDRCYDTHQIGMQALFKELGVAA